MQLLIDNQPEILESLSFHYQDLPIPGGHTYWLKLNDTSLTNDLKRRFGNSVVTPSRQEAETIFGMLNSVVSFKRFARPHIAIRFLANSVTSLEIVDDIVVCGGVCSKVV